MGLGSRREAGIAGDNSAKPVLAGSFLGMPIAAPLAKILENGLQPATATGADQTSQAQRMLICRRRARISTA